MFEKYCLPIEMVTVYKCYHREKPRLPVLKGFQAIINLVSELWNTIEFPLRILCFTPNFTYMLLAVDSNQGGRIPSPTESVDTQADKSTRISADTTFLQQGHKTFSKQNKQFDPGRSRGKAPIWNAAVTLHTFCSHQGRTAYFVR